MSKKESNPLPPEGISKPPPPPAPPGKKYRIENGLRFERSRLRPGQPCNHPGCCAHISHPCEVCGRTCCQ
jgi:hypothetical protein